MTDTDSRPTTPGPEDAFASLVLSLAAASLAYMGKALMPGMEKPEKNMPLAQQTIETLEMLKTKTEGNRTPDETKLLDDLLYELRMAYLKAESDTELPTGRIINPNG
jgi:hypothetical protein